VNTRITFGAELRYAMHVRGLSLTDVGRLSGVAVATASSAAMGRPVNVTTALRVARAVAARPIIPELLEWVQRPPSSEIGLGRADTQGPTSNSVAESPPKSQGRTAGARRRLTDAAMPRQLHIGVD